jgi:hypothetical protein
LTLEQQITVINENTIMLPQICQWYLKDFEIDLSGKKKNKSSFSSSFC